MATNWHTQHKKESTAGDRIADIVASGMGSWRFIIIQTTFVAIWILLNVIGFMFHWDVYPFILLNLLFSTQAAYAAPVIMMAQNRAADRDRLQAANDYRTNVEAEQRIEALQKQLAGLEIDNTNKRIRDLQQQVVKLEKELSEKLAHITEVVENRK